MTDKDNVIQIYLSTNDNVLQKTGKNQYVINFEIDHVNDVVSRLKLNGKDTVYIHLVKPFTENEVNAIMTEFCRKLVFRREVLYADYSLLSMPDGGGGYHTMLDADNNIIEDRYMIIYRKR